MQQQLDETRPLINDDSDGRPQSNRISRFDRDLVHILFPDPRFNSWMVENHPNRISRFYRFLVRLLFHHPRFTRWISKHYPRLYHFQSGIGLITNSVWRPIFTAAFLHDCITFFSQPHERYGNLFYDILWGNSPNELGWTSRYGSNLPGEFLYWVMPLAISTSALVAGSIAVFRKSPSFLPENEESSKNYSGPLLRVDRLKATAKYASFLKAQRAIRELGQLSDSQSAVEALKNIANHKYLSDEIDQEKMDYLLRVVLEEMPRIKTEIVYSKNRFSETDVIALVEKIAQDLEPFVISYLLERAEQHLKILKKQNGAHRFISHLNANYQLWSRGNPVEFPLYKLTHISFWLFVLYESYTSLRLIEMFGRKIVNAIYALVEFIVCTSIHKQYLYFPEYSNTYDCYTCDWDFVSFNERKTGDGCLNGLLSIARQPADILNYLSQLSPYGLLSGILNVDLSQQDLSQWSKEQWLEFLAAISNNTDTINVFNFSSQTRSYLPATSYMQDFISFLNNAFRITALDISNRLDVPTYIDGIMKAVKKLRVQHFISRGTNLSEDGAIKLSQNLNETIIQTFIVDNNKIDNLGISQLTSQLPNTTNILSVANNKFDYQGLQSLGENLIGKNVTRLNVEGNNLSLANMTAFGELITNTSVESANFRNTKLPGERAVDLMKCTTKGNLREIIYDRNPISQPDIVNIIIEARNKTVTSISLSYLQTTDQVIYNITSLFPETNINHLCVAGGQFTCDGFTYFMKGFNLTKITSFDVSDNPSLGDNATNVFVDIINQFKIQMEKINFSGIGMTDDSGSRLVGCAGDFKHLILRDNNLGDPTIVSYSKFLPNSRAIFADFTNNKNITTLGLNALSENITHSQLIKLILTNNKIINAVKLANITISPTPHTKQLGKYNISQDEIGAIRRTFKNSPLYEIDLEDNPLDNETLLAFQQIQPNAGFLQGNLRLPRQNSSLHSFTNRGISPTYNAAQQNATISLGVALLAGGLPIIFGLLALYVLYRAISPLFNRASARFFKSEKQEEVKKIENMHRSHV